MNKIFYFAMATAFLCGCSKDKEEDPEKMGSIYGVVTDKATGESINAASVELGTYDLWIQISSNIPRNPIVLKRTVTGSEGQYEFQEVDAGDLYYVKISTEGYEEQYYRLSVQLGKTAKGDIQMEKINTYMTVRTLDVTDIGGNSATLNGIYDYTSSAPNEYGFLYATQSNPSNGGTRVTASLNTATSNSYHDFIKTITDLPATTYYVQAYAKNSRGTEYGEVRSFIISGMPTVSTLAATNVTANAATLNGEIEFQGDPTYTEKGFVYSNTFQNPTIEDDASATIKKTVSGTSTEFSANVTGLTTNTTYYVRAYVISSKGTVYGESVSFVAMYVPDDVVVLLSDGLMVQKVDISSSATWKTAQTLCETSTVGGKTDWRLPTISELTVLYNKRNTIGGFTATYYWSGTQDHIYNGSSYIEYYYKNCHFADGSTSYSKAYILYNNGRISESDGSKIRVRAVRTLP
ncbi:MAG: DUF1566 domain-containing protein [Prevotellaceae bacterium]|jgi:hypothetical protein|nr:DUF1566 domain-containing protein [Prevotellaceae bacterium]